jgi:hypothetical protein
MPSSRAFHDHVVCPVAGSIAYAYRRVVATVNSRPFAYSGVVR